MQRLAIGPLHSVLFCGEDLETGQLREIAVVGGTGVAGDHTRPGRRVAVKGGRGAPCAVQTSVLRRS